MNAAVNYKKILERHTVLKCIVLITALLTGIAYMHELLSPYLKFLLIAGLLATAGDLVRRRLNLKNLSFWLLMLFTGLYCVTALTNGSAYGGRSIRDIAYMVMLFALLFLPRKGDPASDIANERRILAKVAIISMLVMELTCLAVYLIFPASLYVTSDGVTGYIGSLDGRLCGLVHMNVIGGISALSLILCAGLIVFGIKGAWMYICAGNIAIATATLVLSGSRTALLALAIACIYAVLRFVIWGRLNNKNRKRFTIGVAALVCIAAFAAGIIAGYTATAGTFDSMVQGLLKKADALLSGRVSIWAEGLDYFLQNPLLGVTSQRFMNEAVVNITTSWNGGGIHSIFVGVLVCSGIAGAVTLAAFTVWNIIKGYGRTKAGIEESRARHLCGVMLAFFIAQGFTENYLLYGLSFFAVAFWMIMGVREDG